VCGHFRDREVLEVVGDDHACSTNKRRRYHMFIVMFIVWVRQIEGSVVWFPVFD
jgi:hypothetical protein